MTRTGVFVSYSHLDAPWKERLVTAPRAQGCPGQIDTFHFLEKIIGCGK